NTANRLGGKELADGEKGHRAARAALTPFCLREKRPQRIGGALNDDPANSDAFS
ncbi:uncharacterized, partial [Tachysurus ichikawai]